MALPSSTRPKCLLLKTLNCTTSCVVSCLLEKLQKQRLILTGLHLGSHELMPWLPPSVFFLVPLSQALARTAEGTSQGSQFALELAGKGRYYSFDVCSLTEIKWAPLQCVVSISQHSRKEVFVQRLLLHLHISCSSSGWSLRFLWHFLVWLCFPNLYWSHEEESRDVYRYSLRSFL